MWVSLFWENTKWSSDLDCLQRPYLTPLWICASAVANPGRMSNRFGQLYHVLVEDLSNMQEGTIHVQRKRIGCISVRLQPHMRCQGNIERVWSLRFGSEEQLWQNTSLNILYTICTPRLTEFSTTKCAVCYWKRATSFWWFQPFWKNSFPTILNTNTGDNKRYIEPLPTGSRWQRLLSSSWQPLQR